VIFFRKDLRLRLAIMAADAGSVASSLTYYAGIDEALDGISEVRSKVESFMGARRFTPAGFLARRLVADAPYA